MRGRDALPPYAAWRHRGAREGFEVAFFAASEAGLRVEGQTVAVEDDEPFAVRYAIELDERWCTRSARVSGQWPTGGRTITLETSGDGRWVVDGEPAPGLDGCLDVDLESSSLTNAFPVHRLGLAPGAAAEAPGAWVRALDLRVERLEQRYVRLDDDAGTSRYEYTAPTQHFRCELVYDSSGLVLDYPGLAVRV